MHRGQDFHVASCEDILVGQAHCPQAQFMGLVRDSIHFVAKDGISGLCQVNSDLVCSSSQWPGFYQGMASVAIKRSEPGLCGLASLAPVHLHAAKTPGVGAQRQLTVPLGF